MAFVAKKTEISTAPKRKSFRELSSYRWWPGVTGQLMDMHTCGLDNSRTRHLTDWSTHGPENSWTGQVADATGDYACLVFIFLAIYWDFRECVLDWCHSHVQLCRATSLRNSHYVTNLHVWHGVSLKLLTAAQLLFRIECCSILYNFVAYYGNESVSCIICPHKQDILFNFNTDLTGTESVPIWMWS